MKNYKVINEAEYKRCSDCKDWFPMNKEFYYKNKTSPDGFHTWCKSCTKERAWNNYLNDPTGDKRKKKIEAMSNYADTQNGITKGREASERWREKGGQREYYKNNKDNLLPYHYKRKQEKTFQITDQEWEDCKNYFNNSCSYCEITEEEHKKIHNQRLNREHVDHEGSNYLDNCVPSCRSCNSKKHDLKFEFWYKERSENFTIEKYNKILKWIKDDHKKYKVTFK